jgi:hypothetical protein
MKNTNWLFITLLCVLFWMPIQSFGQTSGVDEVASVVLKSDGDIKNIVKISPFHFAEGTFLLSYERMLAENKSSIMLSAGLHSRSNYYNYNYNSSPNPQPEFGFQEELQFRLYVIQPQSYSRNDRGFWYFKGFYAGPYLQHRYLQRTVSNWDWVLQVYNDEKQDLNEISGGVLLGVQVAIGNRFFMDFYTGGGIKQSFSNISQYSPGIAQPGYSGVIPKIGFQFGVGL